jgi:hypothetical protein
MNILIGSIVAFFALSAPLPSNRGFHTEGRCGRRVLGSARISPTSLSDEARYDTWLCVRE